MLGKESRIFERSTRRSAVYDRVWPALREIEAVAKFDQSQCYQNSPSLEGSFSAVSKLVFAGKYSFCSIIQALHFFLFFRAQICNLKKILIFFFGGRRLKKRSEKTEM